MKPRAALLAYVVGAALSVGLAGCESLRPSPIPAIEALQLDADGVRLRAAPPGERDGWQLLYRSEIVSVADVRRGEAFAVWDGRSISDWYQLLWFDERVATFKRTRVLDDRGADGSLRSTSEVVRIAPYDLTEEPAGGSGDTDDDAAAPLPTAPIAP